MEQPLGQIVQIVALQVQLSQFLIPCERLRGQRLQVVVGDVQNPQGTETSQSVGCQAGDVVVLQTQRLEAPQPGGSPGIGQGSQLVEGHIQCLQLGSSARSSIGIAQRRASAQLLGEAQVLGGPYAVLGEIQHLEAGHRAPHALGQLSEVVVAQMEFGELLEALERLRVQLQALHRPPHRVVGLQLQALQGEHSLKGAGWDALQLAGLDTQLGQLLEVPEHAGRELAAVQQILAALQLQVAGGLGQLEVQGRSTHLQGAHAAADVHGAGAVLPGALLRMRSGGEQEQQQADGQELHLVGLVSCGLSYSSYLLALGAVCGLRLRVGHFLVFIFRFSIAFTAFHNLP